MFRKPIPPTHLGRHRFCQFIHTTLIKGTIPPEFCTNLFYSVTKKNWQLETRHRIEGIACKTDVIRTSRPPIVINLLVQPLNFCSILSRIGRVLEVDEDEDGRCSGRYARIRINLNIAHPLQQGIWVQPEYSQEKICIILVYEKLPNVCFKCGRVGHVYRDCVQEGSGIDFQFGNWLRASNIVGARKSFIAKSSLATTSVLPNDKSPVAADSDGKLDSLCIKTSSTIYDYAGNLSNKDDIPHSIIISQLPESNLSDAITSKSIMEVSDEEGRIFTPATNIISHTQRKKWKRLAREIPSLRSEHSKKSYVKDAGKHELDIQEDRSIGIKRVKSSKMIGDILLQSQVEAAKQSRQSQ